MNSLTGDSWSLMSFNENVNETRDRDRVLKNEPKDCI